MSRLKLIGCALIIISCAFGGRTYGEYILDKCRSLELTAEMLRRMLMILEYEQPTVDEMLGRITLPQKSVPGFVKAAAMGRNAVLNALKGEGGLADAADNARLVEIFSELGMSDAYGERQRLSAGEQYFDSRARELRPEAESRSRLSRSLGLLGGIFIVVLIA